MAIYQFENKQPQIAQTAYVAELCSIIGQVSLADYCTVWDFASIRGDNEPIVIHARSNIQEGAVLHTDMGAPLVVGQNVTVGHQACLHGCTIGDGSLIGIQAIVLNHANIGKHCIIAAGALIPEGKIIPDYSLVMGSPGKVVRSVQPSDLEKLSKGVEQYVLKAQRFKQSLVQLD